MRKTKFQRLTALMLALVFLLCSGIVGVSAADSSSVTETTTDDIKALLNAISYKEYQALHSEVPAATEEIVIDATKGYHYVTKGGAEFTESTAVSDDIKSAVAHVETYDDVKGLYIPGSGTTTWTVSGIDAPTKYSVVIDYYPVVSKPASIERMLLINGQVPFAEARYLMLPKIWTNAYPNGAFQLGKDESAQEYLDIAEDYGFEAYSEERDDGTYIVYSMPEYWTGDMANLTNEQVLRFFTIDIDGNEIRSTMEQTPAWMSYELRDGNGFYSETFEFVLEPVDGVVELSLQSVNEPIAISNIRLVPHDAGVSYDEYMDRYGDQPEGSDVILMEAEFFTATSTQTIYPLEDRTSAVNSPSATDRTLLNTVGGEKWQTAGQWISYQFSVDSAGLYEVVTRYHQNILDGMFVSRALYIFSDDTLEPDDDGYYNGLPFKEAGTLQFGFSDDWQSHGVTGADMEKPFQFYFEEGVVYTIRFEVTLGAMGDIVNTVQSSLDSINNDYLNILKLTGTEPDKYRDYGFSRIMPDTIRDLRKQSRVLEAVADELNGLAGNKSSMTATLERVYMLLEEMSSGKDEDVSKNMEQLKNYIGSLGTWLNDAKTQPLALDVISIQGASEEVPQAKAGFWKSMIYEFGSFFKSFFRKYDRMGALEEPDEDSVEVWLAYGRDQSQVIRNLINNDFTPHTEVTVDLKLVAAGTLLPSILSGRGPDVYIGLGQGDVINYAIRGALIEIEDMPDYEEVLADFNDAAMIVLGIEDADGVYHTYGLPETQTFNMMFVREDILAELGIEIPRTWDDVLAAIPTLQANNMQIGMHQEYKIFLYQKGGDLFADDGMRINLDSNVALEAFETMCNLFTMYSFPYQYDFANRFRTGEMPIGFAAYTATYNQLKVFATEIEGAWSFYPMPGYEDEAGNINNTSVSTVSAIVMITGCEDELGAWEFMKWHAGAQCQIDYSNEMVAIIGPSAKHSTANLKALDSLPWTYDEYEQLALQFNNLASIPNYPGSYIIDRYTNFAFLAAYNDNKDPVTALQSYITTINKEITRKREEFDLETLDYVGQTLAQKRMTQAISELEEIADSSSYSDDYDEVYNRAIKVMNGGETEDYASLRSAADALEEANATVFADAIALMRQAANSLERYEAYK